MKNAYSDEWWNGVQVIGWILFRAIETVNELGEGAAHPLLEMIEKAPHELLARYVSPHPQEPALDELLQAMRTDRLKWSYSTSALRGTPEIASRLDVALHHSYGLYAHGPLSEEPLYKLSELRFRRADVLMQWLSEPEEPGHTPSNSPYWDVLQILAWVATRSPYWTDFADGFESGSHMAVVPEMAKSITGKPYREQRHHRGVALAMLMFKISREKREFGIDLPPPQELWLKVVAAHESGALKLIGLPADGGDPTPLAPHALQGCEIYENAQLGAYVSRRTSGVIGRPLWHGLRALALEVQAAFPRPPELQIGVSWVAVEDEASPHCDLLAAVDWIARHHCTDVDGPTSGPHKVELANGETAEPYSEEQWKAAKEKLRYALQAPLLAATGYRNGQGARAVVPVEFWIDAWIDDLRSEAYDPSPNLRGTTHADTGWKDIKVPKADIFEGWKAPNAALQNMRHTAAAETQCRSWLAELMQQSSHPSRAKAEFLIEAQSEFGVAERAFNRAWDAAIAETGAENWKRPGRRKKSD